MKTVSGRLVTSKPVSVSKAARILTKFVSTDNVASPAFAAYLKRASASFNELVQLHKEPKGSGFEHKAKKHLSDGIITEETVNSVKNLRASNRKNYKLGKRVHVENQLSEGNVGRNIEDVASDDKKAMKKREGGEIEQIADKGKMYCALDNIDANGVENNSERRDGSKDSTKNKNRDKGDKEESDDVILDRRLCQDYSIGEATAVVENGVSERKKHKKESHEKEFSSFGGFKQIEKIKIEGDLGQKQKKKRDDEGEGRESEGKVENKENRKRKHKGSGNEGLDDSEELFRSKKKSRNMK